jgi:hypothetical protein
LPELKSRNKPISILSLLLLIVALPVAILLIKKHIYYQVPNIGGCQIFPADNVWNYDISALPVLPKSAKYIAYFAQNKLRAYFSTPGNGYQGLSYVVVPATQPKVPIHFGTYASESDPGPYPIPRNAPIEDPDASGSDRHVLVLQRGSCKLYELFKAYPNANGSWDAESGAIFDLTSDNLRPQGWTSADAAGLPILPGLVKYNEVASGRINHALRFLLPYTQKAHIWPARHNDGATTDPNAPPEGLRLRLKASVDISHYPPQSKVILQALKQYGMFLADQSGDTGAVDLAGVPDSRWNMTDLASLGNIRFSDFEAVDESVIQVSPDSGRVITPWQIVKKRNLSSSSTS